MKQNKLIIFSLDQKGKPATDKEYQSIGVRLLDFGLDIVEISTQGLGCYTYDDGTKTTERCIVIQYSNLSNELINEVESLALKLYQQESYLIIDVNAQAFLMRGASVYNEPLGKFTRVSKAEAMQQKGWTRIDKSYYTIKKG